ncbi:hypothetical protein, partial [Streptomyces brasiliscabiei]|uniref:hypothetical protein n=1 Tax=Streptomyces brasiliscabiei TaxID=2736302 RepID=UPI0030150CBE
GYIGKSESPEEVRLYLNLKFDEYIDIPKNEILHADDAPADVIPLGGTYLWVSEHAAITHRRVDVTKSQAKFIEGSITQRYLGRSIAPT